MSTPNNRIYVPKTPPAAFNKNRPVPLLLRTQMDHFAVAMRRHMDEEARLVKTEGEAAAYIDRLGKALAILTGND